MDCGKLTFKLSSYTPSRVCFMADARWETGRVADGKFQEPWGEVGAGPAGVQVGVFWGDSGSQRDAFLCICM